MGLDLLDGIDDQLDGLAQFQVRRIYHRLLLLRIKAELGRDELIDFNPLKRPAMGRRRLNKLMAAFGQGHVQRALASLARRHQELKRERGLTRARLPLDQMNARAFISAVENIIES